jgi:type I restriction enzyme R subunit
MMLYTEDILVQQTTAEYMELGWKSVYACTTEDFGPGSLLGRSDRGFRACPRGYLQVFRVYPSAPSPYYEAAAS